jgi:hypothetical protein
MGLYEVDSFEFVLGQWGGVKNIISDNEVYENTKRYRSRIGPESRKLKNMIYQSVIFQSTIIKVQNTPKLKVLRKI